MSQGDTEPLFRSPGGGSDYGNLVQRITELKQNGCNMLVTGRVSDQQTAKATRRFLGCPETPRKRLLALIDGAASHADTRLPGTLSTDDTDVTVLDYRGNRHGATTAPAATDGMIIDNYTPSLTEIRQDICREIHRIASNNTLDPSELRVSVETLSGLLDRTLLDGIKSFLRMMTAVVNEFSGMAHYHLPVPSNSPEVVELLEFVDIHVELRKQEALPLEHRWHLPDTNKRTEWYKLGE